MQNFFLKTALCFATLALLACTDDNSFEVLEDYNEAYSAYLSSVWNMSSSSYSSSSISSSSSDAETSSSSSSSAYYYTVEVKTIVLELTYFEQLSEDWDGDGEDDGDPEISFTIRCASSVNGTTDTLSTGIMLDESNVGTWSGSETFTGTVPVGTDTIWVCPEVVDGDWLFDDDKSSGYCYGRANVGYIEDYDVYSFSDYKSSDYELYWNWYLY